MSPDGERVLFLRSVSGTDPRTVLWRYADGVERPLTSTEVRAYATDHAVRRVAFSTGEELWTLDLDLDLDNDRDRDTDTDTDTPQRCLPTPSGGEVADPRPSPDGRHIAYVSDGALRLIASDGTRDRVLATPEGPAVTYGVADHTAHESIGRDRAYWWAPDSSALLVARVDVTGVARRYVSNPARPDQPPRAVPYPAAGTPNAVTTLGIWRLDGSHTPVALPREVPVEEAPAGSWGRGLEYVVAAGWDGAAPVVGVQSRDQRTLWFLRVDPVTGVCAVLDRVTDPYWVEPLPGVPRQTASGVPVLQAVRGDVTTVRVGDGREGPADLHVQEALGTVGESVLFRATSLAEPTETHVWSYHPSGGLTQLTDEPGVHTATVGGDTLVLDGQTATGQQVTVRRAGQLVGRIEVLTATPVVRPRPTHLTLGRRALRSRLQLPSWYEPGAGPLPVLLAPYGGPAMQVVNRAMGWWQPAVSQWYAEHGFAVLTTDGRGTPGRGLDWLRAIHGDRIRPVLEDQVDALHAAAEHHPGTLDLDRVGVQGWSFGGCLAIGAVLHHPESFHAAVAGAAPTDRRLYDTYWEERHLGHPDLHPDGYTRSDLIPHAHRLTRPLLLLHGLSDANVFPAHTLRLSAALHAAGRPHTVHLIPGMDHHPATPQLATSLLLLQLDFLVRQLTPQQSTGE